MDEAVRRFRRQARGEGGERDGAERPHPFCQRGASGLRQANDQHACVGAWRVLPLVGAVEVLGDEEAPRSLCGGPHVVVLARQLFKRNRIDVVPELREKPHERVRPVVVELDLHRT
jgi:hypothetical protein